MLKWSANANVKFLFKKWIKPCKDASKAVCIYCNSQIAYDIVRNSETKKHKETSEPLNSINMVQLPICFTPAVIAVEKKYWAALSLISINNFFFFWFLFKNCGVFIWKDNFNLAFFLRVLKKLNYSVLKT